MGRAFSLLELVVVMAIMAIAATIAMPIGSATKAEYRAQLASKRIESDMRRLQRDTWFNASQGRIVFDAGADAYDLENLGNGGTTRRVSLAIAPYFADIQSADFGGTNIIVYRGGVPSEYGDGVVRLRTAGTSFDATLTSGQETELKSTARSVN